MLRYLVVARTLATGTLLTYTGSDNAKEAVEMARQLTEQGIRNLQIKDKQTEKLYSPAEFASAHGVR